FDPANHWVSGSAFWECTRYDVSYSYDAAGNRTLQEDSSGATVYTYDAANRLLGEDSSASGKASPGSDLVSGFQRFGEGFAGVRPCVRFSEVSFWPKTAHKA
ncbi:MAG: RHS repeat domain-containing protein, partial [Candidatus Paceibacterota bacterium]